MKTDKNSSEYVEIRDDVFLHVRDWGQGSVIL